MIFGAFGDSFIFGNDLSDCFDYYDSDYDIHFYPNYPSKNTYPAITASNLKMDYLCTACPGIGNMIIHDDVCRIISSYGDSVFYYINWTYSDRFDYIDKSSESWQTVTPGLSNVKADSFYYKNFHAELTDKISTLTYMSNTISLLQENNCKFLMSSMDSIVFDTRWHCPQSIKLLQNKIKPYIFTFEGLDFLSWSRQQDYQISQNNHPLDFAHQNAAKILSEKVSNIICV